MPEDRPTHDAPLSEGEVRLQYPPHIRQAPDLLMPLGAVALGAAAFAGLNALLGPVRESVTICAIIAMQALAAVLLGAAAVTTEYRRRVIAEALHIAELQRERARRQEDTSRSMFVSDMQIDTEPVSTRGLEYYGRTVQPLVLICYALLTGAIPALALWKSGAGGMSTIIYVLGVINIVAAFAAMVGARWFGEYDPDALPEAAEVSSILRAVQWYSFLGGLILLGHGFQLFSVDLWVGRLLLLIALALAGEQVARATLSFMGRRLDWRGIRAPIGLVIAESLFAGGNPIVGTLEVLEKRFGVSVRSSYVLRYIRQTVPLMLLGMLAAFWLMSCLVVIKPDEVGIRTTFGSLPERCWMSPGLRVKWPWPIDRVTAIPASKVQSLIIGHEEEQQAPYLLWSREHAKDEYKLVLGEGRELVSLEAEVFYFIHDPVKYVFTCQNPREMLKSLAYRVLMRETVTTNLDNVLSQSRDKFSQRFRWNLQAEVNARDLGITVVSVPIRGIHPPIDVAESYQSVVSAQVERVTLETLARAKKAEAIPAAQAAKDTAIKSAEAHAAERLGAAKGEAAQFGSIVNAYNAAPGLYKERLWLEKLEKSVAGKQVYLVEGNTATPRDYWLDLRPPGAAEIP